MLDMDSIPPVITMSLWPSAMDWAPIMADFMPEAHTCHDGFVEDLLGTCRDFDRFVDWCGKAATP